MTIRRRRIVRIPLDLLLPELHIPGDALHARYNFDTDTVDILVTRPDYDEVPPECEPPIDTLDEARREPRP